MGLATLDDAGVYRLSDRLALVQTLDFFPPLVDDPFVFGQIAAANALSDVYAMNGQPLTVLNLVGFPTDELPVEVLGEILRGAAERVAAAGAVTVGGHSVRSVEILFGLSVTGLVDPAILLTNAGAQPGDGLVLTKPLGTGFVTTALRRDECPPDVRDRAVGSMIELNAAARDALRAAGGVQALTDVTGFGLAGHAREMAEASGVTVVLQTGGFPRLEGIEPLVGPRYFNRASRTNRESMEARLRIAETADPIGTELAFDPQTSGGLLVAVAPERRDALLDELRRRGTPAAAVVGRVIERQGGVAVVLE